MLTREETWQRLVELGVVSGEMPDGLWDLSGVDLKGADLREANLSGADLSNAHLNEANLSGADLSGADLVHAALIDSVLVGANLKKANLISANLIEVNLFKANLVNTNFGWTNLTWADLRYADIRNASLLGTNFNGAKLNNASLINASLIDSNFNYADLSGAIITGSMFSGCSTYKWNIEGIKAEYLYLTNNNELKEKHKRYFPGTRFEDLYKYMPTIELVFQGVLDIKDILVLSEIVEDIKTNNKELGAEMVGTLKKGEFTHIELRAKDEDALEKLEAITKEKVDDVIEHGYKTKSLARQISGLLPGGEAIAKAVDKMPDGAVINLTVNQYHFEQGAQQIVQPHAKEITFNSGDTYNIKYSQQPDRYDELFKSMMSLIEKDNIDNREAMKELGERLVEAIKTGKEKGIAQDIFDQFSSGVRTSASLVTVCKLLARLTGFEPPF